MPVQAFVQRLLSTHVQQRLLHRQRAMELDQALDRIAALIPADIPLLSDEALRRESLYADDDR